MVKAIAPLFIQQIRIVIPSNPERSERGVEGPAVVL